MKKQKVIKRIIKNGISQAEKDYYKEAWKCPNCMNEHVNKENDTIFFWDDGVSLAMIKGGYHCVCGRCKCEWEIDFYKE